MEEEPRTGGGGGGETSRKKVTDEKEGRDHTADGSGPREPRTQHVCVRNRWNSWTRLTSHQDPTEEVQDQG